MTTRGRLTVAGLVLLIVVVTGAAVSWYILNNPPTPGPTPETVLQEIRQELKTASQESAALAEAVKKEVKSIRGKVTAEVYAMPPDVIVSSLNDELTRFRELESSADRVDSTKTGVLGGN